MAPKHGTKTEERLVKRAKKSTTSRSETPLDHGANFPFKVEYPIMKIDGSIRLEQKAMMDMAEFQVSPFIAKGARAKGELDQYYTVTPHDEWERMKKYNNFIIQGEAYTNSQFVFVRGEDTPKDKDNIEGRPKDFWVARILQVRAKDPQHVYALVTWMYWADEIPPPVPKATDQVTKDTGRRSYHGNFELIASNYMEVLDVLSFAGKADVYHWPEDDDNVQTRLFWRQTYNRKTLELSQLKKHCLCNGHYNPDVPMYICDNSSCKIWFHENHLIDDHLNKTYRRLIGDDVTNGDAKPASKKSKAPVYRAIFKAVMEENVDGPPQIVVTDLRKGADPQKWHEFLLCPKCDTPFE
ncbi:uncharacterized protein RAG0_04464 [Rhynchosporium agropyri]|uniref:BAH domain-containing protein n=1 Tax=Rhynchosporium agropyri TaxID=914238 RepID=A0A1E1K8W5_9HELO|nr:uncharacterized protein RAG0_04464 [Rhynchosporium agropyri]